MTKKKRCQGRPTRMFTRDERHKARVAAIERVRAMPQAEREERFDRMQIESWEISPDVLSHVGEMWLQLTEDPDREPEEDILLVALARQFERLHGEAPTVDLVEDLREEGYA